MVRAALLVLLVAIAGCGGQISPDALAETALNESLPIPEREKAVLALTYQGKQVLPQIRKIVAESKTPAIRAAAIPFLGSCRDFRSGPLLLAACEDPDIMVRSRAAGAMMPLLSASYHFRADDPAPKRQAVVRAMKKSYEDLLRSPDVKKRLEEEK